MWIRVGYPRPPIRNDIVTRLTCYNYHFPNFSRLQCPILDKDDGEWSKLSDERKAELRKEHHLTIEDEYWREDEDGVRPDEPSQIFVDHPPCTINGMGVLVLW